MKYNKKYDRWFTKGGLVYRYSESQDKLILCKQTKMKIGYNCFNLNGKLIYTHRAVYETFKGEIPDNCEIDHINIVRDDNRLENLRAVTHKENMNNELTRKKVSNTMKEIGSPLKGKKLSEEVKEKMRIAQRDRACSVFAKKYKEHFGYGHYVNPTQYNTERMYYVRHNNKCRWE